MFEAALIIAIAIACTAWYMQHRRRRRARVAATLHDPAGLELLARRYARGEIGRDEYLQKRSDILAYPAAAEQRASA